MFIRKNQLFDPIMGAFFIYVTWRGKGSEELPLTYLSAFENDMDMKFKPVVALYILILKNDFEISFEK